MKKLNSDSIESMEKNTGFSVIKFHGSWCTSCEKMNPIFEDLSKNNQNDLVTYYDADVEDIPAYCMSLKVKNIPCVVVMKENVVVDRLVGFADYDSVRNFIDKNIVN